MIDKMSMKNLLKKKIFYGHLVYVDEKQLLISNLCKVEGGGGSDAAAGAGNQGDLVLHGNNSSSSDSGFKSVSKRWEMCKKKWGGGAAARVCLCKRKRVYIYTLLVSQSTVRLCTCAWLAWIDEATGQYIFQIFLWTLL